MRGTTSLARVQRSSNSFKPTLNSRFETEIDKPNGRAVGRSVCRSLKPSLDTLSRFSQPLIQKILSSLYFETYSANES